MPYFKFFWQFSLTKSSFFESDVNICPGFQLNLLKIKNSLARFSLIFENSSPEGFSCQNMTEEIRDFSFENQFWIFTVRYFTTEKIP